MEDFEQMECKELQVGDLVKCVSDQTFPSDIIMLASSAEGDCFIATSSLDGEKNLKKRVKAKDLDQRIRTHLGKDVKPEQNKASKLAKDLLAMKGKLECEAPDKNLHRFVGKLVFTDRTPEHNVILSEQQLLLKGANLKNTEWVVGICVYSGADTKIMMNSQQGQPKMSHLESQINKLVISIIIV